MFIAALILMCSNASFSQKQKTQSADVIIYGGTSAAITAAVQVSKSGKTVLVVSLTGTWAGCPQVGWVLRIQVKNR